MTSRLTLQDILLRALPPLPWAEGDNIPWDDPDFSERMLQEHLSQVHDLASRRLPTIDRHVQWIGDELLADRGRGAGRAQGTGRVLDLACGPGLYVHRLARRGHACVGIDFSPASIRYARETARAEALDCEFVQGDLRAADFGSGFDVALLLYGQLNVFRRSEAADILRRAHGALVPGATLVLEPQTPDLIRGDGAPDTSWSTAERGLFSARPHLLLHERFWDEPSRSTTERWHVIDLESMEVTRHAMTCEAYSRDELAGMLADVGFAKVEFRTALGGEPLRGEPGAEAEALFAVVARA